MRSETQVKICGLTNLADARYAAQSGADLLGFIFYEPSPRYVAPAVVKGIVSALKVEFNPAPRFVGVFVNAPQTFVEETIVLCELDMAQLHGDEPPEFVNRFGGRAFKACNPRSLAEAETVAQQYLEDDPAAMILLDAYHPQLRGGTGHIADWPLAAQLARKHRLLLAGGLTPDNVGQAVQIVKPWGVDVSSGVEASKGKKDHEKVKAFIEAVKPGNY